MHHDEQQNWLKERISQGRRYQEEAVHELPPLIIQKRHRRVITLVDHTSLIDFFSCSYLGLDLDPRVISAASNHLAQCGVTFPAARTRGQIESFITLEGLLNRIFGNAFVVLFSTLHLCHLGMLPLLGSGEMPSFPLKKNGPLFILDKTVHASIQINRALIEQFGEVVVVDFNLIDDVEALFKFAQQEDKTPIAICDSIGSMGGIAPVISLYNFAQLYQGYVYFDDAHGTSVFGRHGSGYVLDQFDGVLPSQVILTSSLAKAFGAIAGVLVLPTRADAEMVRRFASTYVFGGPPALAIIDAAISSAKIHLSDEIYILQTALQKNVSYFDSLIEEGDIIINFGNPSPVRGIFIGDEFKAINLAVKLRQHGIAVSAAMYPTVAKGQSILRITISADHEAQEIKKLCDFINNEVI